MYWPMSTIMSGEAPNTPNTGRIVSNPASATMTTRPFANSNPSVVKRHTRSGSPAPMARETTAVTPTPIPMEMLIMRNTTGNVKLIAASSRAPKRPTQNVSTTLKRITAKNPNAMGPDSLSNVDPTWSSSKFTRLVVI
jgi:hypothetical protein